MRSPEMAMSVVVTPPATMSRRPTSLITRSAGSVPRPCRMARASDSLSINLCPDWFLPLAHGDQRRVAAGGGRVDRHDLLLREARQIVRTARLRPGARQPGPAERLRAHDRTDNAAVD